MKIYCHKCKENLSSTIQDKFEQFEVGRIVCPKCKTKQKRYLSESDMLIYFLISALAYILLFTIIMLLFDKTDFGLITWILVAIIFIIGLIFMKQTSIYIYNNALFKKEIKDISIEEDKDVIRKRMRWQFIMFMLLALFTGTSKGMELYFVALILIFAAVVGIKIYLSLKNEKEAANLIISKRNLK